MFLKLNEHVCEEGEIKLDLSLFAFIIFLFVFLDVLRTDFKDE